MKKVLRAHIIILMLLTGNFVVDVPQSVSATSCTDSTFSWSKGQEIQRQTYEYSFGLLDTLQAFELNAYDPRLILTVTAHTAKGMQINYTTRDTVSGAGRYIYKSISNDSYVKVVWTLRNCSNDPTQTTVCASSDEAVSVVSMDLSSNPAQYGSTVQVTGSAKASSGCLIPNKTVMLRFYRRSWYRHVQFVPLTSNSSGVYTYSFTATRTSTIGAYSGGVLAPRIYFRIG